jgi:hypothetical protein
MSQEDGARQHHAPAQILKGYEQMLVPHAPDLEAEE